VISPSRKFCSQRAESVTKLINEPGSERVVERKQNSSLDLSVTCEGLGSGVTSAPLWWDVIERDQGHRGLKDGFDRQPVLRQPFTSSRRSASVAASITALIPTTVFPDP